MRKHVLKLEDKVVIITGAAGGIGRAVARLFAHHGAILVLTDIRENALHELRNSLVKSGAKTYTAEHNVSDPKSWHSLMWRVVEIYGRVDILVNNAGVVQPGAAEVLPIHKIHRQVFVNFLGTVYGCQAALRVMKAQGSGKIINVASLGGIVPMPGEAVYSATKSAIRAYSFSLYAELLDSPVEVTAVCPDSVATPQLAYELRHDDAVMSFIGEPLKPERVAKGILDAALNDKPEKLIPSGMGIFVRIGMALPRIFFALYPIFKKIGRRTMEKLRREEKENDAYTLSFGDL
ncbi:MAG: SDR family oxidoreductase [Candidatus Aminicenantes bacterium]|jgi:NADP-dependent 3-hydroxy acid dehydrogenase YdfG